MVILSNNFEETQEFLEKALEKVRERDTLQNDISSIKSQQKKLERRISVEEKKIADEINTTIRKRRLEIEGSYDDRSEENRTRKKTKARDRLIRCGLHSGRNRPDDEGDANDVGRVCRDGKKHDY